MSSEEKLADQTKFLSDVREFIGRSHVMTRSSWFRCDLMAAYLRVGAKVVGTSAIICTRIANVEVRAKHQGKGIYGDFLDFVCAVSANPIVIENVLPPEHHGIYLRRGFALVRQGQEADFVKHLQAERDGASQE